MSSTPHSDGILSASIPASESSSIRRFNLTRWAIFLGMALTYALYVMLRATFTYVAPMLAVNLNLSLASVGKISSAFPIAYGFSRLFTGVLVDSASPRIALGLGLLLAGLVNMSMGLANSVTALAVLWGLNGLVQGVGAGASAKMITSWFSRKERGFFWALWSTSANVGGFLAPIACAALATGKLGFRAGMLVPGGIAVAFALLTTPFMRSSPAGAGLTPPWDGGENKAETLVKSAEVPEKLSWKKAFVEGVIKNKTIWGLAVSYFFVYFVRSGMKSWLHFWLLEARSIGAAEAAYRVSGMEVGGILGTFSAGVVSDAADGRRVAVTVMYLVGLIGALVATWLMPGGKPLWDFAVISVLGFMINGPQMMIGLIGAEVSNKRVVATATGVLGWISYLGAAASGFPLSIIIRNYQWNGFFAALLGSSVLSVICLLPFWRLKGEISK